MIFLWQLSAWIIDAIYIYVFVTGRFSPNLIKKAYSSVHLMLVLPLHWHFVERLLEQKVHTHIPDNDRRNVPSQAAQTKIHCLCLHHLRGW